MDNWPIYIILFLCARSCEHIHSMLMCAHLTSIMIWISREKCHIKCREMVIIVENTIRDVFFSSLNVLHLLEIQEREWMNEQTKRKQERWPLYIKLLLVIFRCCHFILSSCHFWKRHYVGLRSKTFIFMCLLYHFSGWKIIKKIYSSYTQCAQLIGIPVMILNTIAYA